VPASVTFTDTTAADPLTISDWAWDFGDEGTSTVQNPVHTYTKAGSYEVTLTVTTEQGEASAARTAAVNLRPQAAFSGEPLTGAGAPHVVQFMDTTDPGNLTLRGWDWNFGDGTHSTQQNPSHTFTTPDVYDVTLTVITDIGNSATTQSGFVVVRPEAAFSANITTGVGMLAVQFTDETDPGNLDVLTWAWNFGDGATSGLQHPAHSYTQPGTYTVTLTTGSSEGPDTETKTGYIVVMPNVNFAGDVVSGTPPLEVTFTDTTNTGTLMTTARLWDLGEGDPSMEDMPVYTYEDFGLYDVTLTITTGQGEAFRTRTGYISVVPDIMASFALVPGTGTASATFTNETDTGDLTGVTWLWDFGDNSTATDESPAHNFTAPGIYEVRLTVNSAEGVTATETITTVEIDPVPSFTATPDNGAAPLDVQFTDTSIVGDLEISAWSWDFGDGNMGTSENPMHTYTAPGAYMVSLTITTALGDTTVAAPVTVTVSLANPMEETVAFAPDIVPDDTTPAIFFDLAAETEITLESITVFIGPGVSSGSVRCYTTPISAAGREMDPQAWTLRQALPYGGAGALRIPLPDLTLDAGERLGFYLDTTLVPSDADGGLLYQKAQPATSSPIFSDGRLRIYTHQYVKSASHAPFSAEPAGNGWLFGSFKYRHKTTMQRGLSPDITDTNSRISCLMDDGGWAAILDEGATLARFSPTMDLLWARDLVALELNAAEALRALEGGLLLLTATAPGSDTPVELVFEADGSQLQNTSAME